MRPMRRSLLEAGEGGGAGGTAGTVEAAEATEAAEAAEAAEATEVAVGGGAVMGLERMGRNDEVGLNCAVVGLPLAGEDA